MYQGEGCYVAQLNNLRAFRVWPHLRVLCRSSIHPKPEKVKKVKRLRKVRGEEPVLLAVPVFETVTSEYFSVFRFAKLLRSASPQMHFMGPSVNNFTSR